MRVEPAAALAKTDSAALVDLWVLAWTEAWPGIDFEARRDWFVAHLAALLASGTTLLLAREDDGAVAGFLTLDPSSGEVDQLAVSPGRAGRGVGRALIEDAKRRGPGHLHLAVNQGNARAVRVYARAGFKVTGETRNARSGLPVWLMRWPAPS